MPPYSAIRYGTPKEPVMLALAKGRDVLFDIDWQGTQQLRQQAGDDLVSIFILPPSHEELERRLRQRAQDSQEVVAARMAKAADEISHWAEYDYVVINDDLDAALSENGDRILTPRIPGKRVSRRRTAEFPAFVSKPYLSAEPSARCFQSARQRRELLDLQIFRPCRGINPGFFQQGLRRPGA